MANAILNFHFDYWHTSLSDKYTLIYISGYISAMWSCEQQGASCNQVIPAPLAQEYKSDLHQSHCKQNKSSNYIQKVFFKTPTAKQRG